MPSASAHQPRLLIVGAGGLGFSCAFALSQISEPEFQVVLLDDDAIELSNLNRQLLFSPADVGQRKAERLSEALNEIRPGRFLARVERFTESSAAAVLDGIDLLIDCTDSVQTKLLINDIAVQRRLPFVYGGAIAEEGVALLRPGDGAPCLRCLFGDFSPTDLERYGASCSRAGILGPVAGMIGVLQAQLALYWLHAQREATPRLYQLSSDAPTARAVMPKPDPCCSLRCSDAGRTVQLDLTAERCPMTFLYTKLAVEELGTLDLLAVRFVDLETAESVRRSAVEAGYGVLEGPTADSQGGWALRLARSAA